VCTMVPKIRVFVVGVGMTKVFKICHMKWNTLRVNSVTKLV
jgi:hypothetical protein